MDKEYLTDLIYDIIYEHDLDWGNGEVDIDFESKAGYLTAEAPHHVTVYVDLDPIVAYIIENKPDVTQNNDKIISGNIERAIAESMETFSADEEFDELYEPVTSNPNNHFTPSGFLRMLESDEEFFTETARKLRQEVYGTPDLEDAD